MTVKLLKCAVCGNWYSPKRQHCDVCGNGLNGKILIPVNDRRNELYHELYGNLDSGRILRIAQILGE